jgi:hypothetical protein
MSRNDPAFLFYPGDASEDTQFMNRLERGAYFDVLKAQKRYGRFSFDMIKKVLGNDFENVWPALKICLTCEEDMYFISWVNNSIENRRAYSESRRNNRKGNKKEENNVMSNSQEKDMNNICTTHVEHMGNEIGNENINTVIEGIGVQGEKETPAAKPGTFDPGAKVLVVPELRSVWMKHRPTYQFEMDKDAKPLRLIGEAIAKGENVFAYELAGIDRIKTTFEAILVWSLSHSLYKSFQISQFEKYFQAICEAFRNDNGTQGTTVGSNGKGPAPHSPIQTNIKTANDAAELIKRKYQAATQ